MSKPKWFAKMFKRSSGGSTATEESGSPVQPDLLSPSQQQSSEEASGLPKQEVQQAAAQHPEQAGTSQAEGAVALPSTSSTAEQSAKGARPKFFRKSPAKPLIPEPKVLAEVSGFVYHEPDLVMHIRNCSGELTAIASNMNVTSKNIRDSTDDLILTYNRTTDLFRARSPVDDAVKRAIIKLEENVNLQEDVTEAFIAAADSIYSSVIKLNQQIERMTSVVAAKIPLSLLLPPPSTSSAGLEEELPQPS